MSKHFLVFSLPQPEEQALLPSAEEFMAIQGLWPVSLSINHHTIKARKAMSDVPNAHRLEELCEDLRGIDAPLRREVDRAFQAGRSTGLADVDDDSDAGLEMVALSVDVVAIERSRPIADVIRLHFRCRFYPQPVGQGRDDTGVPLEDVAFANNLGDGALHTQLGHELSVVHSLNA